MKLFAAKSVDALEKKSHIDKKDFVFLLGETIKDVVVEIVEYINFFDKDVKIKIITITDRFNEKTYGFAYLTEDTKAFITNEDEERIKMKFSQEWRK